MIGRRRGGDTGVDYYYVDELTTKPANIAFECDVVSILKRGKQ